MFLVAAFTPCTLPSPTTSIQATKCLGVDKGGHNLNLIINLHTLITNSLHKEISFGAAYTSSASQEFLNLLWNLRVNYFVHNSPPSDRALKQINSPLPSLYIIQFNCTLPPKVKSLSLKVPDQNTTYIRANVNILM
jgi:hypothetical protein